MYVPEHGDEICAEVVARDQGQDCAYWVHQKSLSDFPRETKKDLHPKDELDKSKECWKKGQWRILMTPEENRKRKQAEGGSSVGARLGTYYYE